MKTLFLLATLPVLASVATPRERTDAAAVNPPREMARSTPGQCPNAGPQYAQTPLRAVPQRLIDLPPARLELTVWRMVAGCPEPVVLREGIGGTTPRQEARVPGEPD